MSNVRTPLLCLIHFQVPSGQKTDSKGFGSKAQPQNQSVAKISTPRRRDFVKLLKRLPMRKISNRIHCDCVCSFYWLDICQTVRKRCSHSTMPISRRHYSAIRPLTMLPLDCGGETGKYERLRKGQESIVSATPRRKVSDSPY